MLPPPPSSTLFPYTTLFRSLRVLLERRHPPQQHVSGPVGRVVGRLGPGRERVPQHRLLDSLEHRRVVDPARAALDVGGGGAWMGTPGRREKGEEQAREGVDA